MCSVKFDICVTVLLLVWCGEVCCYKLLIRVFYVTDQLFQLINGTMDPREAATVLNLISSMLLIIIHKQIATNKPEVTQGLQIFLPR